MGYNQTDMHDTSKETTALLPRTHINLTGLWQMFNAPIVCFVPILFNSSHCSPYS